MNPLSRDAQVAVAAALLELVYGTRRQRGVDMPGPWVHRAACTGLDPELFYPDKGLPVLEAKKVCRRCPVRVECLDWAIETRERFGVWGGLSPLERRRLWKVVA